MDVGWIHPWVGLDWVGLGLVENFPVLVGWVGLGLSTHMVIFLVNPKPHDIYAVEIKFD